MLYFSSDFHLSHFKIIQYCSRPFKTVAEMNDRIITNCNEKMRKDDILYFLGDFAFAGKYDYIASLMNRINARKVCILGNHDKRKIFEQLANDEIIESVHDVLEVHHEKQTIWLSHYAHKVWPKSHHGSWHLYGHSHSKLPNQGFSMDIGVDTNGFYPYSFDNIKRRFESIEKNGQLLTKIYSFLKLT